MKNVCIIFLLSIIISLTALGFTKPQKDGYSYTQAYFRIHIRADSNAPLAQAVKYQVRDKVVEYLAPYLTGYTDKESAVAGVKAHLPALCDVTKAVLEEQGFTYGASAQIQKERFPTRVYGEYTLPAGEYTALIITLGEGNGDNWWCVVYPPLCFTGAKDGDVVYRSKIQEIIQSWRAGKD